MFNIIQNTYDQFFMKTGLLFIESPHKNLLFHISREVTHQTKEQGTIHNNFRSEKMYLLIEYDLSSNFLTSIRNAKSSVMKIGLE